jgi:RHS repeat-associated protein
MKKILFLLLISQTVFGQTTELVDNPTINTNSGKSYIYLRGVKLVPPSGQGLSFSGSNQTISIKPADAAKLPQNIPPSPDQNFTRKETILVNNITSEDQISSLNYLQRGIDFSYIDATGRPSQLVALKGSPQTNDIVKYFNYDAYSRIVEDRLPYVSTDQNGAFKSTAISSQSSFYTNTPGVAQDSRPFIENEFEVSPLNRVKKSFGPGSLWKTGSVSKSAQASFNVNAANEVRRWFINASGLPESDGYYEEAVLTVSTGTSEENSVAKSYSDYTGTLIMDDQNGLITYYVYDGMGMLRFVLPPELSKLYPSSVSVALPDQTLINTWAFQYLYDTQLRLTEEKGPGPDNDWIYYVYDQWNRLVAKQDGVQRNKSPKEWSFIKYDALNRPVITGLFNTSMSSHASMISAVSGLRYEDENSSTYGYTLTNCFPNTNQSGINSVDVLTINYYDDYSFLAIPGWAVRVAQYSPDVSITQESALQIMSAPKGQLTGSKIRGVASGTWHPATFYYDYKYNQVLTVQQEAFYAKPDGASSITNTADRLVNAYDFTGKVLESYRTSPAVAVRERFEYDHAGRPKKIYHSVNGVEILLASVNYNELGQLIEKNLHSTNGGQSFLQSVDYRYNIRGWLTSINNSQLASDGGVTNNDTDDLFGMNLTYNQESFTIDGPSTQVLYDGRISATRWMSKNLKEAPKERAYNYYYDTKSRFQESKFGAKAGSQFTDEAGYYNLQALEYDDNGNIKKLKRYAKVNNTKTLIDDLTYGYGSNGNQLTTVEEGQGNNFGYPNATTGINPELQYDKNGNLTSDLNSQIVSLTYNFLNLPETVTIDLPNTTNDNIIEFKYDATGYLIKKTYFKGSTAVRTIQYDHGIQYIDGQLATIFTSEGRITKNPVNSAFEYEYFLKDHLTNTRVVFGNVHDSDVYKATMEDNNDNSSYTSNPESSQFSNITATRSFGFNHTSSSFITPSPNRAARVNGYNDVNEPARIVGPAKMLQVKNGEKVSMEVYARYNSIVSSNAVVTTLASAITGAFGLTGSETQAIALNNATPGLASATGRLQDAPKAYLCYILFNSNYQSPQFGFARVDNTAMVTDQLLSIDLTVPADGYLYMFVADESNVSLATKVYFDDFKITHHRNTSSLRVTEVTDYDPYGFVLEGTRYVDESRLANNYKYQGDFAEFESLTGWTRFEGRGNYDGRLGRWHSGDPANQFVTPYAAMANNPVMYSDPDGRFVPILIAIGAGLIGGATNVYGHWDKIGSFQEGLDYFSVGAVSGAVAVVNPVAGGAIAAGGNAVIDLMHGRTPEVTEMVMDFGYTFIGGKGTQRMVQGLEKEAVYQAGRTILRSSAVLGEEEVVLKEGVKNAARNADGSITAATKNVGQSVIDHVNMKTVEVAEQASNAASRFIGPGLKLSDNKLIQHAQQWGIAEKGAALTKDQLGTMRKLANHIYKFASTVRQGTWGNPAAGGFKDAIFYSNGKHVVVTQSDGTMITILRNAMGNKHFNNALTIWTR